MRSKVIIFISFILLLLMIVFVYQRMNTKSASDYFTEDGPFYQTKIDGFEFYVDEVDDVTAMDVANMLSLLGVDWNISVSSRYLSEDPDEMDMDRDAILEYTDDVDFSEPVYTAYMGGIYYVYSDTSGVLHGMHLDSDYNLIELK